MTGKEKEKKRKEREEEEEEEEEEEGGEGWRGRLGGAVAAGHRPRDRRCAWPGWPGCGRGSGPPQAE